MYIESRNNLVRLNVAQEVMRFAVDKQAEFADSVARQAEEARKEMARKASAEVETEANKNRNGQTERTVETDEQQPQKVAGGLGITIDIQV
jgi:hypothetical protein